MPNLNPSTPTLSRNAVAPEELLSLVQKRAVVLVDVRSRWQRRAGHIPGSHSIPAGLLLSGEWPDGDLLLIGVDSAQSQALIETMHDLGYNRQLRFLDGGYQAWVATTSNPSKTVDFWHQTLLSGQQLIAGPALGMVVLLGPWMFKRSRA